MFVSYHLTVIASWLRVAVGALAGMGLAAYVAYALLSLIGAAHWRASRRPTRHDWTPPVTILKPICGVDAELEENLDSFCRLDYPPDRLQILFGARDPDDPGLDVARRTRDRHPHLDITVIAGIEPGGVSCNRKVVNLMGLLPYARHDLLTICDSDMRVRPDYLRRIVAPFQSSSDGAGRVGLVTCPYIGCRPNGLAATLEAIGIGADFMPGVLVSRRVEGVSYGLGSTMVIPRDVLKAAGGFEPLRDQLADDYQLGNRVKRCGYRVILSDYVIDSVIGRVRFQEMWRRRLRWARTMLACRPGGYAGSVITHGLALALILAACLNFSPVGWSILAAALTLRLGTLGCVAIAAGDRVVLRRLYLVPISDLLTFALYVVSFCGKEIRWRGEEFRLLDGGRLGPIEPAEEVGRN